MKGEGGVCRWFMFSSIWPFDYAKRKRRKYVKSYWFSNLNLCFENCNHPILTCIDFISILCNVIEVNFDKRILFKDIIFPPFHQHLGLLQAPSDEWNRAIKSSF